MRNKIECIDAIEGIKNLDDNSVHLTVTSPPYNISHPYDGYDDNLTHSEWKDLMEKVLDELFRATVDGGKVAINVGFNMETNDVFEVKPLDVPIINIANNIGYTQLGEIIWDKCNLGVKPLGTYPHPEDMYVAHNHEYIILLRKPGERSVPNTEEESAISKRDWGKAANSVWEVPVHRENAEGVQHGAAFPAEIPSRLIKLYSFRDEVVLDPFTGTGTTLSEAKRLDRDYVGFDVVEEYVEYSLDRVNSTIEEEGDLISATDW